MLPSRSIGLPGGLKSGPLMPLYLAFLPVGFTMPPRSPGKRWALTLIRLRQTHLFTLTLKIQGGIFSVALSLGSLPLRVTEHCVLWSSDFPLHSIYCKKIEVVRTGAAILPASGLGFFIKEKYAFAIWAKN